MIHWLAWLMLLLVTSHADAQAIGAYGRVLGAAGQKQGKIAADSRMRSQGQSKDKTVIRGLAGDSAAALPSTLKVAVKRTALHHRHDEWSDKIADLDHGESLTVVVDTTVGSNRWYMVKTKAGVVGWVKAADVKSDQAAQTTDKVERD
ncbi:MAG TPA: hypothetical protein VNO43_10475 [Candidatus Eisenbacteria bacterium]|nr:hypothetical protein [Candidatus Eisenbacteria bacterium]